MSVQEGLDEQRKDVGVKMAHRLRRFSVVSKSITPDNIAEYSSVFEDAEGHLVDVDFPTNRLIGVAPKVSSIAAGLIAIDKATVISPAGPIKRR